LGVADLLALLTLALLPGAGNFAGALLAELRPVSARTLSLALHAAAGVVLAVVGVELMPTALAATTPWVIILAFMLGGVAFILLDQGLDLVRRRATGAKDSGSASLIYVGVAVDLLSDGIMIGASVVIDFRLALLLALGQVTADLPEGFATMAAFRRQGVSRGKRLLLSASFFIPVLVGAVLSFVFLRGQSELLKLSLLAFTAGILTTVVVEEIVPEAHREAEARLAALALVGGFALFTAVSTYLG
jgi:ZIP family zinc transporter